MADKTLADSLREEGEALRRRFVWHTRPNKGPLSLEEANNLCRRMFGEPKTKESAFSKTLGPL